MSKVATAPSSTNALATIPDGFDQVPSIVLPEQTRTPYVAFVYERSNGYSQYLKHFPDLKPGEPVLVHPAPALPQILRPFKYFLLAASQFWAKYDQSGKMLESINTKTEGYDETIESVVLVVLDKELIPAQIRFKTTTCPGIHSAVRALGEADLPSWSEKGPDYKFTLRLPKPWMRFVTEASRITRANRTTGVHYPTLEATSNPTSAANCDKIFNFRDSSEKQALLRDVLSVYEKRVIAAKSKEKVTV